MEDRAKKSSGLMVGDYYDNSIASYHRNGII